MALSRDRGDPARDIRGALDEFHRRAASRLDQPSAQRNEAPAMAISCACSSGAAPSQSLRLTRSQESASTASNRSSRQARRSSAPGASSVDLFTTSRRRRSHRAWLALALVIVTLVGDLRRLLSRERAPRSRSRRIMHCSRGVLAHRRDDSLLGCRDSHGGALWRRGRRVSPRPQSVSRRHAMECPRTPAIWTTSGRGRRL